MRFDVYVSGHFQNVQCIMAQQTYPVLLRCTVCDTEHAKYASLALVGARQKERVSSKVSVTCRACSSTMDVLAESPKAEHVRCTAAVDGRSCWVYVALNTHSSSGFCVSMVDTANCTLVEVPMLEIDVITGQNVLFKDISLEENNWVGTFKDHPCAHVDAYEILVKPAKCGLTCGPAQGVVT
eukprot:jgi/Antlo1/60/1253